MNVHKSQHKLVTILLPSFTCSFKCFLGLSLGLKFAQSFHKYRPELLRLDVLYNAVVFFLAHRRRWFKNYISFSWTGDAHWLLWTEKTKMNCMFKKNETKIFIYLVPKLLNYLIFHNMTLVALANGDRVILQKKCQTFPVSSFHILSILDFVWHDRKIIFFLF